MIDTHSSLTQKLFQKGFWLYLFSFLIAPIGYIVKILISGEVSVSELGILYGVISLITLLSAIGDLGISESLKYFLPRYAQKKEFGKIKSVLTYAGIAQIISGVFLTGIFIFGADILGTYYFKDPSASSVIQIFAAFFIGVNIFQIMTQFFLAIQNTFAYKLCEFVRNIFLLLSTIAFISLDTATLVSLSYGWIIGLYIGVLLSIILFLSCYYKKYFQGERILWSKSLAKKFFHYAGMVFLSGQTAILLSQIDMQMIIYLLGTSDAGYYAVYLSLIMIPFLIIGPIFVLLLPLFSQLVAQNQKKQIMKLKRTLSDVFLSIGITFGVFLFVFSGIISWILFGENFAKSGEILMYSSLFLVCNLLFQINFNLMGGLGKVKKKLQITLITLGLNTIMNFILIHSLGVSGAALATGIGWFAIYLMSEYGLGKKYMSFPNMALMIKNIIFMGLFGFFCYYFVIDMFEGVGRMQSLGWLMIVSLVWTLLFGIMHYKQIIAGVQQYTNLPGNKS